MRSKESEGGKGWFRRQSQIEKTEEDLRWELFKSTTSPERKEEIKQILEKITRGGDEQ